MRAAYRYHGTVGKPGPPASYHGVWQTASHHEHHEFVLLFYGGMRPSAATQYSSVHKWVVRGEPVGYHT